MIMDKPTLGIIGAGKVGNALARLLNIAGYKFGGVYSPTTRHAWALSVPLKAAVAAMPVEVVRAADLVLLTVPDDAIEPAALNLRAAEWGGKGIVHMSGVRDASPLRELAERGAMVGSLHPAFPFADVQTSMAKLAGTTFAVEADAEQLRGWLYGMIQALQGYPLDIAPGQKALYHAALVIASNYTVTLYAAAERLLTELGADRFAADRALNALLAGTMENLGKGGIPDALTGPLARGDVGTINAHLKALSRVDVLTTETYIALARLSYPMLEARGIDTQIIERLLRQEDNHADDSP